MLNNFIYIVVFFILAFVIIVMFKAVNQGLKFRKKKKKIKYLYLRKNYNLEISSSLVFEIKLLKSFE